MMPFDQHVPYRESEDRSAAEPLPRLSSEELNGGEAELMAPALPPRIGGRQGPLWRHLLASVGSASPGLTLRVPDQGAIDLTEETWVGLVKQAVTE